MNRVALYQQMAMSLRPKSAFRSISLPLLESLSPWTSAKETAFTNRQLSSEEKPS